MPKRSSTLSKKGGNCHHRVPFGVAFGGAPVEQLIGGRQFTPTTPFCGRRPSRRPQKGKGKLPMAEFPILRSTGARPVGAI